MPLALTTALQLLPQPEAQRCERCAAGAGGCCDARLARGLRRARRHCQCLAARCGLPLPSQAPQLRHHCCSAAATASEHTALRTAIAAATLTGNATSTVVQLTDSLGASRHVTVWAYTHRESALPPALRRPHAPPLQ
jgi:hypothetical protein